MVTPVGVHGTLLDLVNAFKVTRETVDETLALYITIQARPCSALLKPVDKTMMIRRQGSINLNTACLP